jgi:ribosomal protein S18 acetylase RimI-like enzyme
MLIMDAPIKGSDICGRYKFKTNSSDRDYIGSFDLFKRCGRLEIWSFEIYGEHRGQGFGQQMMREAIEVTQGHKLVLYVEKDNVRAIHVYEKCGFRITGKFMGDRAWTMTYVGETESATNERELCCA